MTNILIKNALEGSLNMTNVTFLCGNFIPTDICESLKQARGESYLSFYSNVLLSQSNDSNKKKTFLDKLRLTIGTFMAHSIVTYRILWLVCAQFG